MLEKLRRAGDSQRPNSTSLFLLNLACSGNRRRYLFTPLGFRDDALWTPPLFPEACMEPRLTFQYPPVSGARESLNFRAICFSCLFWRQMPPPTTAPANYFAVVVSPGLPAPEFFWLALRSS